MSVTTFSFPTPTVFGVGALGELVSRLPRLGLRRPLVVTDAGLVKTDAFAQLARVMGEAGEGKHWFVYSGVHPNPVEDDVREAANAYRHHHCDGVVAIAAAARWTSAKPRACWSDDRTWILRVSTTKVIGRVCLLSLPYPLLPEPAAKWGEVR